MQVSTLDVDTNAVYSKIHCVPDKERKLRGSKRTSYLADRFTLPGPVPSTSTGNSKRTDPSALPVCDALLQLSHEAIQTSQKAEADAKLHVEDKRELRQERRNLKRKLERIESKTDRVKRRSSDLHQEL